MNNQKDVLTVKALTPRGALRPDVRDDFKRQLTKKLEELGFEDTINGPAKIVAYDFERGVPVYARLSVVITTVDPHIEKVRKGKLPSVEIPEIF